MNTNTGNPYGLKPDQLLYLVPNRYYGGGNPHTIRIESVGRKFAICEHGTRRVLLKTLEVDGGKYTSPGRCYLSEVDYDYEQKRLRLWDEIRKKVNEYGQPNYSIAALENIAFLLGITKP